MYDDLIQFQINKNLVITTGWQAIQSEYFFTDHQRRILCCHFQESAYWSKAKQQLIAREVGVNLAKVKNWHKGQLQLMNKQTSQTTPTGIHIL